MAFPNYTSPADDNKTHSEFGSTYVFLNGAWRGTEKAYDHTKFIVSDKGAPQSVDDVFTATNISADNKTKTDDAVAKTPTAKQKIALNTGELEIDAAALPNATDVALSVTDGGAAKFSVGKAGNIGIGGVAYATIKLLASGGVTEQGIAVDGKTLGRAVANSSCFDADNYDNSLGGQATGFRASANNSATAASYTGFQSFLGTVNVGTKTDTAHINCSYNGAGVFRVRPDGVTQSTATITGSTAITSDPRLKTPFTPADYTLDHLSQIEVGHYSYLDDPDSKEHLGHNAADFADHIPHCMTLTTEPVPAHADLYYDDVEVEDDEGNITTERRRNDVPLDDAHAIKAISVGAVIALHTQMLQHAHADNEAQKDLISDLRHDLQLLEHRLEVLENA